MAAMDAAEVSSAEIVVALNDGAWYRPRVSVAPSSPGRQKFMRTVFCVVACVVLMVLPVGVSPDRAHAGQGTFQILQVVDEWPSSALLPQVPSNVASSADSSANALSPNPLLKATEILKAIQKRHGDPLPGYVGGRIFHNRERTLPPGRYREYDVNPKIPGRHRGPERLVIDQRTGKAYYTADHYVTFIPMN